MQGVPCGVVHFGGCAGRYGSQGAGAGCTDGGHMIQVKVPYQTRAAPAWRVRAKPRNQIICLTQSSVGDPEVSADALVFPRKKS